MTDKNNGVTDAFILSDGLVPSGSTSHDQTWEAMLAEPHILVSFADDTPEVFEGEVFGLGIRFMAGRGPKSNEEILMLLEAACETLRRAGVGPWQPDLDCEHPECIEYRNRMIGNGE